MKKKEVKIQNAREIDIIKIIVNVNTKFKNHIKGYVIEEKKK